MPSTTHFDPERAVRVEILARRRTEKLTRPRENIYIHKVLSDLLDVGLAKLPTQSKHGEIDHLLTRVCDRDLTLAGLGLTLPD